MGCVEDAIYQKLREQMLSKCRRHAGVTRNKLRSSDEKTYGIRKFMEEFYAVIIAFALRL